MSAPIEAAPTELGELTPLIRRAAALDPRSVVRLRIAPGSAMALVRLPFGVLVGRRVVARLAAPLDATFATAQLLTWLETQGSDQPTRRDEDWRAGLPPDTGWRRIETVPDDVVRGLVRQGALTLKEAAEREGVPRAQPRAEVADALLDSIVLTATSDGEQVEVTLRLLSALVRMGFLARDSHLAIDVAGRWLRLAATYGSAYAEKGRSGLGLAGVQPHGRVRRQ